MSEYLVFDPSQYLAAIKQGIAWQQQLNNIDGRADQIGHFVADSIKGSRLWELDLLMGEAKALKEYRQEFVAFLMDRENSPLIERKTEESTNA